MNQEIAFPIVQEQLAAMFPKEFDSGFGSRAAQETGDAFVVS